MTGLYRCGLVVGKFCPLHRGHELLIGEALRRSEHVVVISYTVPGFAGYECAKRDAWIAARFPRVTRLVIDDETLAARCRAEGIADAPGIPFDDAPDDVHRRFVAWLCIHLLRAPVDSVFTSEDYGDGFAEVLGECLGHRVDHVCVDRVRSAVPVSGTRIRVDPLGHREYLSPEVWGSFVKRICILGGESSGKTTLAQALAERLDTVWVAEYGRYLWEERSGALELGDMLHIAETQVAREETMAQRANRFLICDTSPLTTLFYSRAMFDRAVPELEALADRPYDHVLLCAPDFAFVQDGTRRDDAFRQKQHQWYRDAMATRDMAYVEVSGGLEQRVTEALRVLGEERGPGPSAFL